MRVSLRRACRPARIAAPTLSPMSSTVSSMAVVSRRPAPVTVSCRSSTPSARASTPSLNSLRSSPTLWSSARLLRMSETERAPPASTPSRGAGGSDSSPNSPPMPKPPPMPGSSSSSAPAPLPLFRSRFLVAPLPACLEVRRAAPGGGS